MMKKLALSAALAAISLSSCAARMDFSGFQSLSGSGLTGGSGPSLYVQNVGEAAVVCGSILDLRLVCAPNVDTEITIKYEYSAGIWINATGDQTIPCTASGNLEINSLTLMADKPYRVSLSQDLGSSSLAHVRNFTVGPTNGCTAEPGVGGSVGGGS